MYSNKEKGKGLSLNKSEIIRRRAFMRSIIKEAVFGRIFLAGAMKKELSRYFETALFIYFLVQIQLMIQDPDGPDGINGS